MNEPVQYRSNSATWQEIAAHLARCDADFVPPLAGRVEIDAYAQKIAAAAMRFEAWDEAVLAGLVAMYRNDQARTGFITSVSVLRERTGQGIAAALMKHCIEHAAASGLRQVRLEVGRDNAPALRLYAARGFVVENDGAAFVTMVLDLHNGNAHERQA